MSTKMLKDLAAKTAEEFSKEAEQIDHDYDSRVESVAQLMKSLGLTTKDLPMIGDTLDYSNRFATTPLPSSDEDDEH